MSPSRRSTLVLLATLALAGCGGGGGGGGGGGDVASGASLETDRPAGAKRASACPGETRGWMGKADVRRTRIPVGGGSIPALAMAPAQRSRFPGARPVAVFQHGVFGDFCNQYWIARYLAGHGYVALTYTTDPGGQETSLGESLRAVRAAVDFAESARNPFRARTDPGSVGVGGFSLGAVTASIAQADRDVDAAIVLDNLRRWRRGDPGGVAENCTGPRAGQIRPGAPALGFAQDSPCKERPGYAPSRLKQFGFRHWRANREPSMELVLRGFQHTDYGNAGSDRQRRLIAYYAEAWFDRWLGGQRGATKRLLAARVQGRRTSGLLSRRFDSGAYLPGRISTTDYR